MFILHGVGVCLWMSVCCVWMFSDGPGVGWGKGGKKTKKLLYFCQCTYVTIFILMIDFKPVPKHNKKKLKC